MAAAPLITDTPIILVALVLMPRLNASLEVMGVISLAGAVFIAWMAVESLAFKGSPEEEKAGPRASIWRGVLANALNPSPYLFWFTVRSTMAPPTVNQKR